MLKAITHFPQVPLDVVAQIVERNRQNTICEIQTGTTEELEAIHQATVAVRDDGEN